MTPLVRNAINFLQKPFKENLTFFLELWFLISIVDVLFWSIQGNFIFGAYMSTHGFVYAYVIVLICNLLRTRAKKIYRIIFIVLGLINLVVDSFVHYIMHSGLSSEIVAIIRGSNPSEGAEFISMYIKPGIIAFIIICIAVLIIIRLVVKEKDVVERGRGLTIFLSLTLVFSITYIGIRQSKNWETVFLHKVLLFTNYHPPKNLTPYRNSPSIQINGDTPQNIVLIIGESLSRNHCSLYGYDKQTTPQLSRMANDSLVYVYNKISAAYYITKGAFSLMMSTYSQSDGDIEDWYKSTFLEDITTAMGYHSVWISNQSPSGFYDNPVARIAELSDSLIWMGAKFAGFSKSDFDEIVIPPVQDLIKEGENNKTFFIVHLMGQHEDFSSRFPDEFRKFEAQDYMNRPNNQRQVIANYDNAVLYGDWVVSELMQSFSDKEAIVFFFPDHALDVFDTDPTYVGHARPADSQSVQAGLQIPFMVYTTDLYRKHFPDKNARLLKAVDKPYNTEDLPYTIMDVANASFTDNPELVGEKSLLSD